MRAVDYVLVNSWTCRRFETHTRWLVRQGLLVLPSGKPEATDFPEDWTETLTTNLRERVLNERILNRKLGNPILVWFLFYVLIPIVVRLLLDWWFKKGEDDA